jgi:hypothetical protein
MASSVENPEKGMPNDKNEKVMRVSFFITEAILLKNI